MTRSSEAITADLDKILGTLRGLRTGLKLQRPLIDMKLGQPTGELVERVAGQILDVFQTYAVVLKDLDDRTTELVAQQAKIADGVRDSLRVLT
jgi:hypothetical protein